MYMNMCLTLINWQLSKQTNDLEHGVGWFVDLEPTPVTGPYIDTKKPPLVFKDGVSKRKMHPNHLEHGIGWHIDLKPSPVVFEDGTSNSKGLTPQTSGHPIPPPTGRVLPNYELSASTAGGRSHKEPIAAWKKQRQARKNRQRRSAAAKRAAAKEAKKNARDKDREFQLRRSRMTPQELAADIIETRRERKRRYALRREARIQESQQIEGQSASTVLRTNNNQHPSASTFRSGDSFTMSSNMGAARNKDGFKSHKQMNAESMGTNSK